MRTTACPKLRGDLTWRRFIMDGVEAWVVKDEVARTYQKFDLISGTLAHELDGAKSPEDLLEFARVTWPSVEFDADYIADLVQDLKSLKLLEDPFERNAMLEARARTERSKISAATFRNLFNIDLGVWDPDGILDKTYPYVAFMFRPVFVALGLALFLFSGLIVWLNRDHIAAGSGYLKFTGENPAFGMFLIWVAVFAVIMIHEFGHGYAVKHYGGKVHRMGFLLLFGMPCMFCDTSDSNLFPNRWHRVAVGLAGTYTQLYGAAIATLIWWATPSGSTLNQVAYNLVLFSSVSGILINYNPLVKLDGYYVLADSLDMPSLYEDGYAYLGYLVRRYLLGMKLESPVVGRRRKRILAIYAAFSIAYSIFFSTLLFILIRKFLIGHLALLGVLISLVLLYGTVRRPLGPLVRTGRLWALDHRGSIRRRQIPLVGAAALSIGAFFLLPVPGQRTLDITLEPARQAAVVVPEDLCLKSASFAAGQRVSRGQTLAVLDADSLARGQEETAARAQALRVMGRAAERSGDPIAVATRERATANAHEAGWLSLRVERTVLRAPFDGIVLTPRPAERVGEMLAAGDTLCMVGDFSAPLACARVEERDLDDLHLGFRVRLRLRSAPAEALHGRVQDIEPLAEQPAGQRIYRVWIALDQSPREPRAGLTGRARVTASYRTPASHCARWLARVLRLDLWV